MMLSDMVERVLRIQIDTFIPGGNHVQLNSGWCSLVKLVKPVISCLTTEKELEKYDSIWEAVLTRLISDLLNFDTVARYPSDFFERMVVGTGRRR